MAGLQIPGIEPVFKPQTTGLDKAMEFMGKAQSTAGGMQQNIPTPDKTVGGGITGGLAGAQAGLALSGGNPVGAGVGALVGAAGYYLS